MFMKTNRRKIMVAKLRIASGAGLVKT